MGWHNVEKLLEQAAAHSTLIGKFWTTFFYVLRFLIVISIADKVFGDDFGKFKCNTLTPGCENICFNDFSPISMVRLWALQLLSVAIPAIIFIVYTVHKMNKIAEAKKKKAQIDKERKRRKEKQKLRMERLQAAQGIIQDGVIQPKEKKETEKKESEGDGKIVATKLDGDMPSRLLLAYVGQLILRLVVEIVFMWAQYNTYVYKFWMPEIFKCARYPCKNVVDCFVSRPKEKTIIMWIMFSTGLLMIFLNLIELHHIGIKKIWNAWKNRGIDITKVYKVGSNSDPQFRNRKFGVEYPFASGIPIMQPYPYYDDYSESEI